MKRKVCVITGSRAEYGLLRPLMKEISKDHNLKLQLIVTGMHLSKEFGLTYREIEADQFNIDQKINIQLKSDDAVGISNSMAVALKGFSQSYHRLKPDIIIILGDRFEITSAVIAAHVAQIPIAHIDGGELTEGAFDDALRHSITKMSHLHFTSAQEYRKRVIQLGENPKTVFNVGALALDSIESIKLLSKKDLEQKLKFKFNKRNYLTTFHPVTLESSSKNQFKHLIDVFDGLKDTNIIFTKTNADTGGRVINKMIDDYVNKRPQKAAAFNSMGQKLYFSTMRIVDGVVGNSSSGIIETPLFGKGTVNIGTRQKGRIRTASIIDCVANKEEIRLALKQLNSKRFQEKLKRIKNPYGNGRAAKNITEILGTYELKNIVKKTFYDVNVGSH